MSPDNRYLQKLPGVFRCIGQFIIDHADQLAGDIESTKDFEMTISVNPGNESAIFVPYIKTNRTYIVRPGLRYYYDRDFPLPENVDPDGSIRDAAVL